MPALLQQFREIHTPVGLDEFLLSTIKNIKHIKTCYTIKTHRNVKRYIAPAYILPKPKFFEGVDTLKYRLVCAHHKQYYKIYIQQANCAVNFAYRHLLHVFYTAGLGNLTLHNTWVKFPSVTVDNTHTYTCHTVKDFCDELQKLNVSGSNIQCIFEYDMNNMFYNINKVDSIRGIIIMFCILLHTRHDTI